MRAATSFSATVVLGLCCAWPAAAQTQPLGSSLVVEAHGGLHDPLGTDGLALVFDRGGRLSAGVGAGWNAFEGNLWVNESVFGRVRVLRRGPFALDAGTILSRGRTSASRTYNPPNSHYPQESLTWKWSPAYRATGTLGAEVAGQRWSFRLEAGLGYLLNRPTCRYSGSEISFTGDCNSDEIPAAYHFSVAPGQIVPSFGATLGYRLGVSEPETPPAAAGDDYRSPTMALALSTLSTFVPIAVAAVAAIPGSGAPCSATRCIVAPAIAALGITFGPSVGYAYAGEPLRAWGMGALRLAVIAGGTAATLNVALSCLGDDETPCPDKGNMKLLAATLFTASFVSAVYDIATVPNAVRRSNAQHRLTNLGLVPVVTRNGPAQQQGLALAGQF